jgi:hypothetical protein
MSGALMDKEVAKQKQIQLRMENLVEHEEYWIQ